MTWSMSSTRCGANGTRGPGIPAQQKMGIASSQHSSYSSYIFGSSIGTWGSRPDGKALTAFSPASLWSWRTVRSIPGTSLGSGSWQAKNRSGCASTMDRPSPLSGPMPIIAIWTLLRSMNGRHNSAPWGGSRGSPSAPRAWSENGTSLNMYWAGKFMDFESASLIPVRLA